MDGRTIIAPLVWYPRLWHGTPEERNNFEIIGDGSIIHWPDLDEDLSVAGLLAGRRSGESTIVDKMAAGTSRLSTELIGHVGVHPNITPMRIRKHPPADHAALLRGAFRWP